MVRFPPSGVRLPCRHSTVRILTGSLFVCPQANSSFFECGSLICWLVFVLVGSLRLSEFVPFLVAHFCPLSPFLVLWLPCSQAGVSRRGAFPCLLCGWLLFGVVNCAIFPIVAIWNFSGLLTRALGLIVFLGVLSVLTDGGVRIGCWALVLQFRTDYYVLCSTAALWCASRGGVPRATH